MRDKLVIGLVSVLVLLLVLSVTTGASADFSGSGAFGSIRNFLKRVNTNIVPSKDNAYSLGSSTKKFTNVYATASNMTSGNVTGDFSVGGNTTLTGNIAVNGGNITSTGNITVNATSSTSFNDENITNVGNVALDSITGDGSTISIGGTDKYIVCQAFTSAGINASLATLGAEGGEVYLPEGDYDYGSPYVGVTVPQDNIKIIGGPATRLLATNRFVYTTVTGTPAAGETLTGDSTGYTATVIAVDVTNKIVWYHSISNTANYNNAEVISWSGGADTTINGTAPTEQSDDAIDVNGKSKCVISGLTMYGGSGGGNNVDLIVDAIGADNLLVERCYLHESDSKGIDVKGAYTKIDKVFIEEPDSFPIAVTTGDYLKITDTDIKTTLFQGISISAVQYAEFSGLTLEGCGNDAIRIQNTCHYSTLSDITIINTATGYADILVGSDYITMSNIVLLGSGTSDTGIHLDDADYCSLTNVVSTGHDVVGIDEDSDCTGNSIYGNNLQDAVKSTIEGTLHERLDLSVSLVDETGIYTLRDAKTGWGHIVASDDASYAYFTFTAGGVVTLVSQNNVTTTQNNDGTLNIYDSGTAVVIENELGGTESIRFEINYLN